MAEGGISGNHGKKGNFQQNMPDLL